MKYFKVPIWLLYRKDAFIGADLITPTQNVVGSIYGCDVTQLNDFFVVKSEEDISKIDPELLKYEVSELEIMAEML